MELSLAELLVADESSLSELRHTAAKEGHTIGGQLGGDHVVKISPQRNAPLNSDSDTSEF
jgi:hypothetical protein